MASRKLEIQITAKDQSKRQLRNVDKQLKSVDKTAQSLSKRASKGFSNMRAGILGITVAFAGLALGVKSVIKAFNEQETAERRLEQIATQVSKATRDQIKAIKEQAAALQKLGVVGDEVLIAGQSQLASFSLQADQISQLTAGLGDLIAANKGVNGTQQDAILSANALGKAIGTGLLGPLKLSGILLTDQQEALFRVSDQQERVNILTEVLAMNYGGLNEALAGTAAGGLKQLSNAWGDTKEQLGKRIIPLVLQTVKLFNEVVLPSINKLAVAWDDDFAGIRSTVVFTTKVIQTSIKGWIEAINLGIKAVNKFGGVAKAVQGETGRGLRDFLPVGIVEQARALITNTPVRSLLDQPGGPKIPEIDIPTLDPPDAGPGPGGGGKGAVDAAEKLQSGLASRLGKARQSFRDLTSSAKKSLEELAEVHDKNIEKINGRIEDLRDSLKGLEQDYNATIKGLDISAAEKIVEQEELIKQLQEDLKKGETADVSALKQRLAKEQAVLKAFLDDRTDLEDEVVEARRRAQLTDFERFVEDLKTKTEQEKTNFDIRKAQIEEEIATLEDQKERETKIFEEKQKELQNTLDAFETFKNGVIDGLMAMQDRTEISVKIMEDRLARLQRLLKQVQSVSGVSGASIPNVEARANGGPVTGNQPFLVGERGPELFIPSSSGNIVPNGMGNITVNVTGNNITSPADEDSLAGKVAGELTRILQLRKIGAPS